MSTDKNVSLDNPVDDDDVPLTVAFSRSGSSTKIIPRETGKGPVTRGRTKDISEKVLKKIMRKL